ncbi:hypothetical protein BCR32DRAFT_270063 [Anaeromyces robustus]|uniref:Crossover junction endonuclease MUS81 n=1 Tax=Anaeromyces robustus TaxID=1754192 RepID=A0A1Y1WZ47_9FUNG|nr:hypothetical protein BCR32DRAFT_270063 [Anaeromyces robustus]|eukprot:ORX78456.1 hypothetical protein BCR32DRAFT_270063 [Anaeromyces robustus]
MIVSNEQNADKPATEETTNIIVPTLLSLAKIWLTEWVEQEKKKRIGANLSRLYFTFSKALESVKNSKEEDINTIGDLGKLKGIGEFILGKIKKRLLEYQTKTGNIIIENLEEINNNKNKNNKNNKTKNTGKEKTKRRAKKRKEYIPAYRSGSYAILITLYEYTSNHSKSELMLEPFLTKSEIIRHGQKYCSSSFTVPLNGTHFTAWSSMNELIRRELVGKMGSPSKYYLTDEGIELAKKLAEALNSNNTFTSKSIVTNSNKKYLINNDDDFQSYEELNSSNHRLSYLNEKYEYAQINGKSMSYLNTHHLTSTSTSKLNSKSSASSISNLKNLNNNLQNKQSKKSSIMYKTVTKPFLQHKKSIAKENNDINNKSKSKSESESVYKKIGEENDQLNEDTFHYFYLNDEDDSVYDKSLASKKYVNDKCYSKVYYPKKYKDHLFVRHITNKMSFGGYIIGYMDDSYGLLIAPGFNNKKENLNEIIDLQLNSTSKDDKIRNYSNNENKNIMEVDDVLKPDQVLNKSGTDFEFTPSILKDYNNTDKNYNNNHYNEDYDDNNNKMDIDIDHLNNIKENNNTNINNIPIILISSNIKNQDQDQNQSFNNENILSNINSPNRKILSQNLITSDKSTTNNKIINTENYIFNSERLFEEIRDLSFCSNYSVINVSDRSIHLNQSFYKMNNASEKKEEKDENGNGNEKEEEKIETNIINNNKINNKSKDETENMMIDKHQTIEVKNGNMDDDISLKNEKKNNEVKNNDINDSIDNVKNNDINDSIDNVKNDIDINKSTNNIENINDDGNGDYDNIINIIFEDNIKNDEHIKNEINNSNIDSTNDIIDNNNKTNLEIDNDDKGIDEDDFEFYDSSIMDRQFFIQAMKMIKIHPIKKKYTKVINLDSSSDEELDSQSLKKNKQQLQEWEKKEENESTMKLKNNHLNNIEITIDENSPLKDKSLEKINRQNSLNKSFNEYYCKEDEKKIEEKDNEIKEKEKKEEKQVKNKEYKEKEVNYDNSDGEGFEFLLDSSPIKRNKENKRKKFVEEFNNKYNNNFDSSSDSDDFEALPFLKKRKTSSNFISLDDSENKKKENEKQKLILKKNLKSEFYCDNKNNVHLIENESGTEDIQLSIDENEFEDDINSINNINDINNDLNNGFNDYKDALLIQKEEEEILKRYESIKNKNKEEIKNLYIPSINQRIVLQPNEYEIILLLDNREISTKTDRTYIQKNLASRGINCDTRPLVLGDVTWIAKEKKSNGIEIILDHIIERKRLDDLISSIKDGRFREQKNRLKNCGLNDVIYLVEGTKTKQSEMFGINRIMSALCSTQIYNHFFIKRTSNIEETMNYFSIITKSLIKKYKNKPLYAYSFKRNTLKELPVVRNIVNKRDQCYYHLTYDYFSSINSKAEALTISNIWATWLKCVRGISSDKANTIIYKYPTFALFMKSFKKCKNEKEIEKFFSDMVTENLPKRKKITKEMAKKLYKLYCSENY